MENTQHSHRKQEHIQRFLHGKHDQTTNHFEKVELVHCSLPEFNFDDIDLSTRFLGKETKVPLMINAITGGISETIKMNESLARVAKKIGMPMAVGSQSVALKPEGNKKSFTIVREIMGNEGVVISNLGANQSIDNMKTAVDMLEADALQLHLNVAQEIIMPEGDREFTGLLQHIEKAVKQVKVPIILKEVGFGIQAQTAKQLENIGVKYIDVGGAGGTNFIEIEDKRHKVSQFSEFYDWGIPTADSILQCRQSLGDSMTLIGSGGVKTARDIVKSLCLGADMVGMSGILFRVLLEEGEEALEEYTELLIHKLRIYMLLIGCSNIEETKKVPFYFKGKSYNQAFSFQ